VLSYHWFGDRNLLQLESPRLRSHRPFFFNLLCQRPAAVAQLPTVTCTLTLAMTCDPWSWPMHLIFWTAQCQGEQPHQILAEVILCESYCANTQTLQAHRPGSLILSVVIAKQCSQSWSNSGRKASLTKVICGFHHHPLFSMTITCRVRVNNSVRFSSY